MAVLHDVTTTILSASVAASPSNVNHNAGAGCGGVIVSVVIPLNTDVVTGVTYGGIAMTRAQFNSTSSTETGSTYIYFLGYGKVPQAAGNQAVAISYTGTTAKSATCTTVKSSSGWKSMGIAEAGGYTNTATSTETRLNLGTASRSDSAMAFEAAYSGTAGPMATTATMFGGMTSLIDTDFGNNCGGTFRQTNASDGGFTVGHTQAADDWCSSGISVIEYGTDWSFQYPYPEWDPAFEVNQPAPPLPIAGIYNGVPASDVSMVGWTAISPVQPEFSLHLNIDDGTNYSMATADSIRTPLGGPASFTVGFNLTPGSLNQVRIVWSTTMSGLGTRDCFVELLDGTRVIGTGALHTHDIDNSTASETFAGVSLDADNLFVRFTANNSATKQIDVNMLWVEVLRNEENVWPWPEEDPAGELASPPVAPPLPPPGYYNGIPASDVSMTGWSPSPIQPTLSYHLNIDDGTAFALADGAVLSEPIGALASFTVGFNLHPGRLSQVSVLYQVNPVAPRTFFTQILDGTTVIATGIFQTTGGGVTNFVDVFPGISLDADNLNVRLTARPTPETSTTVDMLWVEVIRDEETLWAYPDWDLANELGSPVAATQQFMLINTALGARM